jgi:hypothetical protein
VATLGIYVVFCYLTITAKEYRNEEPTPATGP